MSQSRKRHKLTDERKEPAVTTVVPPVKSNLLTKVVTTPGQNFAFFQFVDYSTLHSLARTNKELAPYAIQAREKRFFDLLKAFLQYPDLAKHAKFKPSVIFLIKQYINDETLTLKYRTDALLNLIEKSLLHFVNHVRTQFNALDYPDSICLFLKTKEKVFPFKHARINQQIDLLKRDLNVGLCNFLESSKAEKKDAVKVVEKYLAKGARYDYLRLVEESHTSVIQLSVLRNLIKITAFLISTGANINYRSRVMDTQGDYTQMTVLMIAADQSHLKMCELLIKSGANINVKFADLHHPGNRSALWYALRNQACGEDIAVLLIKAGAELFNFPFFDNALHMAAANGLCKIVDLLLEHYQHLCPINEINSCDGKTALHFAIENGYVDVVRSLMTHGADSEIEDDKGINAIQTAHRTKKNKLSHLNDDFNVAFFQSSPSIAVERQIERARINSEYDEIIILLSDRKKLMDACHLRKQG